MARDKLSDADTDPSSTADTPEPDKKATTGEEAPEPSKKAGKKASTKAGAKSASKTAASKTAASKTAAQKSSEAKASATSRRAAEARAAKQRQHRRIEFVRALAIGVEVAAAAGLVVASLLPWEWDEPLWGRADGPWLVAQVALGVGVVALAAGWLRPRNDSLGMWSRALAIPAVTVVGVVAVTVVWQAGTGARNAGGIVAVAAAVLAIGGCVGWLLGLQTLRKLFAFGMVYARDHGYGNLAAVRRAQLIGAPIGAVGAAAVVAGTLLVAPGVVTTVDSTTAGPLALEGPPPSGGGSPSWTFEVDAIIEQSRPVATVRSTPGGLVVDELQGIRVVDPRDGQERWHWRDDAYERVATMPAAQGSTVVLALRHEGDDAGRDRVVALDTATGEVRWDRFDDDLVTAMTAMAVPSPDSAWIAVPDQVEAVPANPADPAGGGGDTSRGVRVVSTDDGSTQWREAGTPGCTLSALDADSSDTVVATEECPPEQGNPSGCQVAGWDAAAGTQRWSWPSGDRLDLDQEYAATCRANVLGDIALLTYQPAPYEAEEPEEGAEQAPPEPEQTPALALDLHTGEEAWVVEPDEDSYATFGVDGVSTPELVGDTVVGAEYPGGQPGNGPTMLVLRSVADGSKIGEVELPEGQQVRAQAAGEDRVLMTYYQQVETPQVLLLEVDLAAGQVASESVVVTAVPEGEQIFSAELASGPETLVVDTLLGTVDQETGAPSDVRLRVHGFA